LTLTPIFSFPPSRARKKRKRSDSAQREIYKEHYQRDIDYDIIRFDRKTSQDILEEIVELMVDVVCSNAPYIKFSEKRNPRKS
jgi:hypothetical protein